MTNKQKDEAETFSEAARASAQRYLYISKFASNVASKIQQEAFDDYLNWYEYQREGSQQEESQSQQEPVFPTTTEIQKVSSKNYHWRRKASARRQSRSPYLELLSADTAQRKPILTVEPADDVYFFSLDESHIVLYAYEAQRMLRLALPFEILHEVQLRFLQYSLIFKYDTEQNLHGHICESDYDDIITDLLKNSNLEVEIYIPAEGEP